MLLTDVLSRMRRDLSDANATVQKWEDGDLLDFLNEGFRELASSHLFLRYDLLVPTAGQIYFGPFAELLDIKNVWYDGQRLSALSTNQMDEQRGSDWMSEAASNSGHCYIPGPSVQIWPAIGSAGTALTFSGSPSITTDEGLGPAGNGFWSASNSGVKHFLPGDGYCTNWNASGNLLVAYHYIPTVVADYESDFPNRFTDAARYFGNALALEGSEDPLDVKLRDRALARYERLRTSLVAQAVRNYSQDHVPTMRQDPASPFATSRRITSRSILGNV